MKVSLAVPVTCLITNGNATDVNFDAERARIVETVSTAAQAGVSIIQIRERHLSARNLFELTRDAVAATRLSDTRVLVNDRPDIAFAAKADGVHLRSDSLPAALLRQTFGRDFVIGVSTHVADEVTAAAASGADFAVFGPIFETPGKNVVVGIETLRQVCVGVAPFPVLAIGGIDVENVHDILQAGASGVAAIRALNDEGTMRSLLAKLG